MSHITVDQVVDKPLPYDPQVAAVYRRAFQRQLRHQPTALQRAAMNKAAIMQARLDAALDTANPYDLSLIERAARTAVRDMEKALGAKRLPALADYVASAP